MFAPSPLKLKTLCLSIYYSKGTKSAAVRVANSIGASARGLHFARPRSLSQSHWSSARGGSRDCPLADDLVEVRKHVRPGLLVLVSGLLVPEACVREPEVRAGACRGQLNGHHRFILRGGREPRHLDEASGLEPQEPAVMGMALILEMHLEEVRRVDLREHEDALGSGKPLLKVRPRSKNRPRCRPHVPPA